MFQSWPQSVKQLFVNIIKYNWVLWVPSEWHIRISRFIFYVKNNFRMNKIFVCLNTRDTVEIHIINILNGFGILHPSWHVVSVLCIFSKHFYVIIRNDRFNDIWNEQTDQKSREIKEICLKWTVCIMCYA